MHLKQRYTKFYGTGEDAAASLVHDAIIGNLQHLLKVTLLLVPLYPTALFLVKVTPG